MSARRWSVALVAAAVALPVKSGAQQAQETASAPTRHVWTAEWKNDLQDPGRPYARHITWRMSFTGVEEVRPDGTTRWLSRQWAWNLLDIYEQIGTIAYDPSVGRYKINITKTCTGGATLDLGATEGPHAATGAPKLMADCEQVVEPVEGRGRGGRSRLTENVNQMPTIRPPQEGCSVSEATRHAWRMPISVRLGWSGWRATLERFQVRRVTRLLYSSIRPRTLHITSSRFRSPSPTSWAMLSGFHTMRAPSPMLVGSLGV